MPLKRTISSTFINLYVGYFLCRGGGSEIFLICEKLTVHWSVALLIFRVGWVRVGQRYAEFAEHQMQM